MMIMHWRPVGPLHLPWMKTIRASVDCPLVLSFFTHTKKNHLYMILKIRYYRFAFKISAFRWLQYPNRKLIILSSIVDIYIYICVICVCVCACLRILIPEPWICRRVTSCVPVPCPAVKAIGSRCGLPSSVACVAWPADGDTRRHDDDWLTW